MHFGWGIGYSRSEKGLAKKQAGLGSAHKPDPEWDRQPGQSLDEEKPKTDPTGPGQRAVPAEAVSVVIRPGTHIRLLSIVGS